MKRPGENFTPINHLFSFKEIQVFLNRSLRTMLIEIVSPDEDNIGPQLITELENLFKWVYPHVEISHILITSNHENNFSTGLNSDFIQQANAHGLQELSLKIQKLNYLIVQLPQLIIFDLKKGISQWGVELSLGADLRIGHPEGQLRLNHLSQGLFPAAGTFTFLREYISHERLKKWLYLAEEIPFSELFVCSFIHQLSPQLTNQNKYEFYQNFLAKLGQLSPVERIQSKKILLEAYQVELEMKLNQEQNYFKDLALAENWKRYLNKLQGADAETEFIRPKISPQSSQENAKLA